MPVTCCPFPVSRCPLPVARCPLPVPRSPFSVLRSPFSVLRSPFSVPRSPFPVHRSPFPVPRFSNISCKSPINGRQKENDTTIMATTNATAGVTQAKTFKELACSPSFAGGLQQQSICFSAVNIFFSITAFLGNSVILVALHKESSLHPPSKLLYRCLAITDLLVGLVSQPLYATYWMSLVYENWSLCRYAIDTVCVTGYTLCGVSLFTMAAISLDRLLALLLGLRYRQIVTLKRTYIIEAIFWIICSVGALCYLLDYRITFSCGCFIISSCLLISIIAHSKIFLTLSHRQAQVHDQQQPSQSNALNMARYRKAVYSALWVQLAFVICYVPYSVLVITLYFRKSYPSHSIKGIVTVFAFFNSTLNPFLYCWTISEVRQAVKQTIRQASCFSWI